MIHFENRDCMDAMKEFPDNFFDLAIVDPPYGDGSQTVNVEREREPTTDSAADSTSTRIPRGGWHGKQKYHLGTPSREELQKTGRNMGLPELVEHGRGNTQKNHCVGCRAETRIFQRVVSHLTKSGNLGWKLFLVAADTLFPDMAQTDDFRVLFNGNVRVRMDIV